MYIPASYRETTSRLSTPSSTRTRSRHSLTALVDGPASLYATHLPLVLERGVGPLGTLRGHSAGPIRMPTAATGAVPALVLFSGSSTRTLR